MFFRPTKGIRNTCRGYERFVGREAGRNSSALRRTFLERCDEHLFCLSYRPPVLANSVEFSGCLGRDVRPVTMGAVYGRNVLDDDEFIAPTKAFGRFLDDGCLCTAEIALDHSFPR